MFKINIIYSSEKRIAAEQLEALFLSVNWSSGQNPIRLSKALQNHSKVYTAWDDFKLVGLISSMDDGIMNAYIQYLLVNPLYQGMGIGSKLLEIITVDYCNYLNVSLISYENACGFYEKFGLKFDRNVKSFFL